MIIKSILDTDLYKITMMYAVVKNFPSTIVRYKFTDRSNTVYPDGFDILLKQEVKDMESLFLTKDEKKFLTSKHGDILPPPFIDLLEGYRFDSNELDISLDKDNHLVITIEGYWYRTILWEIYLMSLISELYFKSTGQIVDLQNPDYDQIDKGKINLMLKNNVPFTDFGSRRRYSRENQERIIKLFSSIDPTSKVFKGTSNVHFAMKYGLDNQGTQAHEWIMVHAALYGYKYGNVMSSDNWVNTYNGKLGISLSDTFTTDVFFRTFDSKTSRLYDGVRHDSNCPFEFTDKVINHYNSIGIDPMTKIIVFSDGLDIKTAIDIKNYCEGKIRCSFGIGTSLTNDLGVNPLKIVIKISHVLVGDKWIPCVKLSDNLGKNTGDSEEVQICKKTLGII